MSIQSDFTPYQDLNLLMAPNPVPPITARGSDNGVMFTSEYIIMLAYNQVITHSDITNYMVSINQCIKGDSLYASPQDTVVDQSPDNYYGLYAATLVLNCKSPVKLPILLYRQPQLLLLSIAARNHINLVERLLSPIAALIIVLSCIGTDPGNTDARRLSWLLIQGLAPKSWLCRQASKIWYKRLAKDYPYGMKSVAGIYYYPQGTLANPYSKYWIDKSPDQT